MISEARRREQLRLLLDPVTRTAAAHVVALQDPEADAFDALYLRYAPHVAAIGTRLLGRHAEANEVDDLVQDVFMQVLQGLSQLREPGAFKGWLAQIAIRGATRRLRRRSLRRAFLGAEVPAPHELLCKQATRPELRTLNREVYEQLATLPPKSRMIWIMRHVEGEALHVIAQRTDCSMSSVQRRLLDAQATIEAGFMRDLVI